MDNLDNNNSENLSFFSELDSNSNVNNRQWMSLVITQGRCSRKTR